MLKIFLGAVFLLGASLTWMLFRQKPSAPPGRKPTHFTLDKSPNHINAFDIIQLIARATLKQVLGYSPTLYADSSTSQQFILPAIRAEGLLHVDEHDEEMFKDALRVDFRKELGPELNQINPIFLVAQTVPLVILALVQRICPIKPLGAVNTRNKIKVLNPSFCRDINAIKAAAQDGTLRYDINFGGADMPGHRRKRGVEFCITIEIIRESELVMLQELWFLQFLPTSTQPLYEAGDDRKTELDVPDPRRPWRTSGEVELKLNRKDPKRWAATSKDYNPIHVSRLGAKLFGFPSVIAHGNHIAALALECLRGDWTHCSTFETAQHICWLSQEPFSIEMAFLRPLALPNRAIMHWESEGDETKTKTASGLIMGVKRKGSGVGLEKRIYTSIKLENLETSSTDST
ncbi:3-hydroxyacyl-thioester dehydratase X [Pseudocercospora fuligena]|uniref:3-hydroxyacyl-thioester dehydratase X n=1 Tax=Pseudocercospora fuligena TaxID=685502 RepID=A0A8H6RC25_9PEZI|nr:3-hydroxyacyl-thioester dehydratase X [Pseudocercospora fuligena]